MSIYENIPVSNDRIVDEAARAPITLFDYSASNQDDSIRAPGLILTAEQLKNIKRYEIAGLALPTQLHNVINYLGYSTGAGKGLEATDFQRTFSLIHTHASSWRPLNTDIRSVGNRLRTFAREMELHAAEMDDIQGDIRALNRQASVEDVKKFETSRGYQSADVEVDASDLATFREVGEYVDQIIASVKQHEADAASIKVRLDAFASTLSLQVRPALQLKLRLIDNNTLSNDIKALNDIIEQRAVSIDEKTKEYKETVGKSVGSAATLNIIGLGMAIYLGVEAEKIRKERDRLKAEQTRDIATMQTKNRILGSLNRVRLDLQDLDLIVIDADIATQNLVTVWNALSQFAEHSKDRAATVNSAASMRTFFSRFRLVAAPWKDIEKDADLLLDVFAQADREFREEYPNSPNYGIGA
ncbi:MAG: hypothetical protein JWQ69_2389 [Pseudomonas sp.]|nr:hypothetical protein [Pseudomonas sp.]